MKTEYVSIKEDVLKKLEANLPEIRERFGIETIGIFGSVSRGEDTKESDIDIAYTFCKESDNLDNYLALAEYLEQLLNRKVDLVSPELIKPRIRPYVNKDMIQFTASKGTA